MLPLRCAVQEYPWGVPGSQESAVRGARERPGRSTSCREPIDRSLVRAAAARCCRSRAPTACRARVRMAQAASGLQSCGSAATQAAARRSPAAAGWASMPGYACTHRRSARRRRRRHPQLACSRRAVGRCHGSPRHAPAGCHSDARTCDACSFGNVHCGCCCRVRLQQPCCHSQAACMACHHAGAVD